MNDVFSLVGLSNLDKTTYLLLVGLFFALFFVAIILAYRHKKTQDRRRQESQWQALDEMVEEKGMPDEEREALKSLIKRWSPDAPLQAISSRLHFDKCIEQEMHHRVGRDDMEEFENIGSILRSVRVYLGLDYIPFGQRINSTSELYEGQQMWMSIAGKKPAHWMRFMVIKVNEAYYTITPADIAEFKISGIKKGTEIECRFWREDDARYSFKTTCTSTGVSPPVVSFQHETGLKRKQARAHFRVHYDQSATVGILSAPPDGNTEDLSLRTEVTKLTGQITSLSAGGLALVIQQALPRQVFLRVSLNLPDTDPIQVEAEIVGSAPISGDRHLVRAAYIGIDDDTRDTIARYVLKRQQPLAPSPEPQEQPLE